MTATARLPASLSFHARMAAACLALAIAGHSSPGSAAASAEARAACTPDVFRLCSAEIPNQPRIIACMKQNRAKLSPKCAAVFHPPAGNTTATR